MESRPNVGLARRLRRTSNVGEQKAWTVLRSLRAQGYPVRRQHQIGGHVVDFAIVGVRLAIEIDGGIHALPKVAARDRSRQKEIESLGWRVIRLSPEVAMSAEHLLERMQRELRL